MAKYTIVSQESCIACGACSSVAPDIFAHNEDGTAYVVFGNNLGNEPIPEILESDLQDAFDSCPSESIIIQDVSF